MLSWIQFLENKGDAAKDLLTEAKKKKKWIQAALNPENKGDCTPMSKPSCTGGKKRFAELMKEKHGFHKKKSKKKE